MGLAIGATNNIVNAYDNIIFNNTDTDSIAEINDLATSNISNNLSSNPTFAQGWYLSTGGSGAIDAGSVLASSIFSVNQTTNVLGLEDTGNVDLGYHYNAGETTVDAGNSSAILSNINATQNIAETLTITILDSASATITPALNVSITVTDVNSSIGNVRDQGDGSYTVSYTPTTTTGTDSITITANGVVLTTTPSINW